MFLEEVMDFAMGIQAWRVYQLTHAPWRTLPSEYLSKGVEVVLREHQHIGSG